MPLTLGIYYTNTSPLSTIIWAQFATKLCFFRLVREDSTGLTPRLGFSSENDWDREIFCGE